MSDVIEFEVRSNKNVKIERERKLLLCEARRRCCDAAKNNNSKKYINTFYIT